MAMYPGVGGTEIVAPTVGSIVAGTGVLTVDVVNCLLCSTSDPVWAKNADGEAVGPGGGITAKIRPYAAARRPTAALRAATCCRRSGRTSGLCLPSPRHPHSTRGSSITMLIENW